MEFIQKIINALTDTSKSLADALLKTKVLASRIRHQELLEWVNSELEGYKSKEVPDYRKGKPVFTCTIQQGIHTYCNEPFPLLLLKEEFRNKLTHYNFEGSIQTLEEQASGKSGDLIGKDYGADMCAFLNTQMVTNSHGMKIVKFKETVHITEITQILSVIRFKLLDFILKIESTFPDIDSLITDKRIQEPEYQEKITQIIHQTIIHAGTGNTIIAGDQNTARDQV